MMGFVWSYDFKLIIQTETHVNQSGQEREGSTLIYKHEWHLLLNTYVIQNNHVGCDSITINKMRTLFYIPAEKNEIIHQYIFLIYP